MAFYSNGKRILNLPEQVEKNAEDIAELNQKSKYADTNIINLQSQTDSNATKISTLETNTTSPDGTITTGTLDVKNNATFGKVIVNSADDITDKDGNAIVKNESLEEFKRLYYNEAADGKFAGMYIAPYEHEYMLEDLSKFTSLKSLFNNCTFVIGVATNKFTMSDIGTCSTAHMFYHCKSIGEDFSIPEDFIIELGNGNSTNGYWMFEGCSTLISIDVAEGKTFSVKNNCSLFVSHCHSLESIGPLDFSGVTTFFYAFYNTPKLKHIHCTHFKVSFDVSSSTAFETADLVEIISNLDPVSTPQTLTMGATNLAKLTQEQILVANGKGWTLA